MRVEGGGGYRSPFLLRNVTYFITEKYLLSMECHLLSDNHKDIYQPVLGLGFIWQSGIRFYLGTS